MTKSDDQPNKTKELPETEIGQSSQQQNMQVTTKEALLALYDVEPQAAINKIDSASNKRAAKNRRDLYQAQQERTRQYYHADDGIKPTYLIKSLKHQFVEYEHFVMSAELDKRSIADADGVRRLWEQIHIVDDIIAELVLHMPSHEAVGWQMSSQGRNYLRLPTVGRVRHDQDVVADQTSINSYVLGHFGVMSFTYDKAHYIGHVLGYLFCCYYFAYLSINYGVTALVESAIAEVEYASLPTPQLVRLLQTLDVHSKQRVYQLAVICARLSTYATDKRIEKMLIAEVNEFDKKLQMKHLDLLLMQGVMPEMPTQKKEGEDDASQ